MTPQQNAYIRSHVENCCEGCETEYLSDGEQAWTPAADCPVHGLDAAAWWADLNLRVARIA